MGYFILFHILFTGVFFFNLSGENKYEVKLLSVMLLPWTGLCMERFTSSCLRTSRKKKKKCLCLTNYPYWVKPDGPMCPEGEEWRSDENTQPIINMGRVRIPELTLYCPVLVPKFSSLNKAASFYLFWRFLHSPFMKICDTKTAPEIQAGPGFEQKRLPVAVESADPLIKLSLCCAVQRCVCFWIIRLCGSLQEK